LQPTAALASQIAINSSAAGDNSNLAKSIGSQPCNPRSPWIDERNTLIHNHLPDRTDIVSIAYLVCVDVIDPDALRGSYGDAAVVLVERYVQQSRFVTAGTG
jgi:hypothetical protein